MDCYNVGRSHWRGSGSGNATRVVMEAFGEASWVARMAVRAVERSHGLATARLVMDHESCYNMRSYGPLTW